MMSVPEETVQGMSAEQAAAFLDQQEQVTQETAPQAVQDTAPAQDDEPTAKAEEEKPEPSPEKPEEESEKDKEASEEEPEELYAENLEQVCEATGTDMDYWYGMKVKLDRMDGENEELTISELKNREQERGYDAAWRARLNEERNSTMQELGSVQQQYQDRLAAAEDLLKRYREFAMSDGISEADKAVINANLDAFEKQAKDERDKALKLSQDTVEGERQRYIKQQQQLLLTELSDWSKPEVANEEWGEIHSYLQSRGITDEEMQSGAFLDHRLLLIARDAAMARSGSLTQKKETAESKIRKLKRSNISLKPGERQTPQKVSSRKRTESLQKLNSLEHGASLEQSAAFLDSLES